ncbi:hypothetical protein D3C72_1887990 [compost metagenome]
MVVAQQMQEAVYKQEAKLPLQGMAVFFSLLLSTCNRDNDIPQRVWNLPVFFSLFRRIYNLRLILPGLIHGKGQHIRRTVDTPVFAVQLVNAVVINKGKVYLTLVNPFSGTRFLQDAVQERDQRVRNFVFFLLVIPIDG